MAAISLTKFNVGLNFLAITREDVRSPASHTQAAFLRGTFTPFLRRFRETDSNRLLTTFYFAALAAFAGTKCAALFPMHCALDALARSLAIFPPTGSCS